MSSLIDSNRTIVIAGRATGKTHGITAIKLANWLDSMPRCVIRICCYTYEGLKMNVLPGIVSGWESMLNYKEGTNNAEDGGHFWVSKTPPKKFKIDRPYRDPKGDVKYKITWWNGAVLLLSSMDRTINNGGEFDAIAFEEVKLMKRRPVKEILLAKRGNKNRFGHLSQYGSVLMVTDRPEVHDHGRWVLDEAKNITPEVNTLILKLCRSVSELSSNLEEAIALKEDNHISRIEKEIIRSNLYLNELRKVSVNFIEVSTLENIHALGVKTIMDYYNSLDPYEYTISVLNQDPGYTPNGFYTKLNKEIHGYRNINYSYIDNLEPSKRSENNINVNWDNDCNLDDRLFIGSDHNAAINNIVTGQIMNKTAYIQSDLCVESPDYLDELVNRWLEFYHDHKGRTVVFFYNSTSVKDDSRGNPSESEVVTNLLRKGGWSVIPEYLGRTPEHGVTQSLWSLSLDGNHPELLKVRVNLQRAERLVRVMKNTGAIRSGNKWKKDKSSETYDYKMKRYKVDPKEATHVSEAADVLLLGMQREYYGGELSPLISSFG